MWKDDSKTWQTRSNIAKLRLEKPPPKTMFWERFQLDAMWVPSAYGEVPIKGLIGVHYSIPIIGSKIVEIFPAPGVMLLRDEFGFTPGLTWGLGIRLPLTFSMLGSDRRATLFVSMAKCWGLGDTQAGMDMVGFSISWKNRS